MAYTRPSRGYVLGEVIPDPYTPADGELDITGDLDVSSNIFFDAGLVGTPGICPNGDVDTGLWAPAADTLAFSAGGSEQLRIGTAGLTFTGVVLAPDGAVGAPGISFSADTDSGWYRIGADNIGLALNGAKVVDYATTGVGITGTLDVSGVASFAAGAAATPSVAVGEATTGLYLVSAGNLGISCSGAKYATFNQYGLQVSSGVYVAQGGNLNTGDSTAGFQWKHQPSSAGGSTEYKGYDCQVRLNTQGAAQTGILRSYYGYTYNSTACSQNHSDLRNFDSGFESVATSSGTWAKVYHYYAQSATVAGSAITDQYGLYIEDLTGAATNNYGIYIAGADTYAIHVASDPVRFDGITQIADGAVGAAGLAFQADLDCGLYRIGADNIGVAVGGSKIIDVAATGIGVTGTFDATGVADFAAGAVGAPAITLNGDTDSGLYQIAADNIGVAVGGAKSLDIAKSAVSVTQAVATTGSPTALKVTGGAHTTLTASTEAPDFHLDTARTVEFATGALTTQRSAIFEAPTWAFVGASTITNGCTVYIEDAPSEGANCSITNLYALWVDGGNVQVDDDLAVDGDVTVGTDLYLHSRATTLGKYAEIYVTGGSTSQDNIDTTPILLTCWANDGANGDANTLTADKANNKITLDAAGTYFVSFSASAINSGAGSDTNFYIYCNGAAQTGLKCVSNSNDGDIVQHSISGILNASGAHDVTVYVSTGLATDDVTVYEAQLSVIGI